MHEEYHKYMESASYAIENSKTYYDLGLEQEHLAYNMWVSKLQGNMPTNRPETVFRYR